MNGSAAPLPAVPSAVPEILKLLADETRWRLVAALRRSDYQVGELVALLQLPQNLVSYHLGMLRQAGLVEMRRSDADARTIYYALELAGVQAGVQQIGASLQLPLAAPSPALPPLTVVFLCSANSARSQIAEAWLRALSGGQLTVRSAGMEPAQLHPLTVQVMAEVGVDIGYQQAKSLATLGALEPDVTVTVCDRAREQCRDTLAAPTRLHWSVVDPLRVTDAAADQLPVFRRVRDHLRLRVEALLALLPTLTADQR
jgi:ArsR family transcriptional regulator